MKIITSLFILFAAATPAHAGSAKWTAVQTAPNLAPMLLAKVKVDSRSYALYRDPQTQECYLMHKNRKSPVSEEQVKVLRSRAVNLAWKIRYQAKHAAKPVRACQASIGEVVVPATDDSVRICGKDRASVKEAQAISTNFDKILAVNIAKR